MTATAPTLTDRYVEITLRRVPAHQRPDIDRELRASIADAVDDRMEAGADRAEAETAVLTELGDPERLAAGYADRPLHLIGPRFFLDYLRLLKVLLSVVLPIVVVVVLVVQIASRASFGSVIGTAVGATITTAVHIAFWTTLVFAALERSSASKDMPTRTWTPDQLPEPVKRRAKFSELAALTTGTVGFSALVLLYPLYGTKSDAAGEEIGFLNPWLFSSGVVYLFVGLGLLSLGGVFSRYYRPGNTALTLGAALVGLAAPALLIWLASNDRIVNPAFTADGWSPDNAWGVNLGIMIGAGIAIATTILDAIRRAARH